jgi:hypothetical protein
MDEVVIDIRADHEALTQIATIGHWMVAHHANPTPGKMPTWEEAVLFCIESCFESLGHT